MGIARVFRKGFTIVELLVSMGLMAMVSVALLAIFASAQTAIGYGGARIELHGTGREMLRRISPYVMSAMYNPANPDPGSSHDAVVSPASGATATSVVFTTTEDFLAANYPSPANSSMLVPNPDNLAYFTYRIRYVSPSNGIPAPSGDVILEKVSNTSPYNPVAGVPTRVLARSTPDAVIRSCTFSRPVVNVVLVDMTVRGVTRDARKADKNLDLRFSTAVNVACYSLR